MCLRRQRLEGRSDAGIGLSLILGKDWQVGDKWNLGVAGHVIGGAIDDLKQTWSELVGGTNDASAAPAGYPTS